MPSEQERGRTNQFEEAAGKAGVFGLNPYCDAIQQPLSGGVRIWYSRDDDIRWVSRTNMPRMQWSAPTTTDVDRMVSTLDAAPEFKVIDSRLHNLLTSGPLSDVSRVHEGIIWGIVITHGHSLQNGTIPRERQLSCVPGIGDKLAREVRSALSSRPKDAYKLPEGKANAE